MLQEIDRSVEEIKIKETLKFVICGKQVIAPGQNAITNTVFD